MHYRHKAIARSHARNNDNYLQSQRVRMYLNKSWRNDVHSKVLYKRRFVYAQNNQFEFKKFRCTTDRFGFPFAQQSFTDIHFTVHKTVFTHWNCKRQNRCICLLQKQKPKLQQIIKLFVFFFVKLLRIAQKLIKLTVSSQLSSAGISS